MSILTRDEILEAGAARKTREVSVPEWGGTVHVREITAGEYDRLQLMQYDARESGKSRGLIRANWVACYLSDADGKRLFTDGDVTKLANMGAKAMDRIFEAGQAFNGLDDLDELEKNSESEADGDSSSS